MAVYTAGPVVTCRAASRLGTVLIGSHRQVFPRKWEPACRLCRLTRCMRGQVTAGPKRPTEVYVHCPLAVHECRIVALMRRFRNPRLISECLAVRTGSRYARTRRIHRCRIQTRRKAKRMDEQKKRMVLIAGLATCAFGAGGYLVCIGGSEAEPDSAERQVVVERDAHDEPKPEVVTPVRRKRPKNEHNAGSREERRVATERARQTDHSRRIRNRKPIVPRRPTLVPVG